MKRIILFTVNTLGIVFIILKLVGLINWSWWWILCPFWIQLAIIMLSFMLLGMIYYSELPVKEKIKVL
jgi:hypothetical protein